jgi:hypothetical protein
MDKLYLDDPRWWPMQKAIDERAAQTGAFELAVQDLQHEMAIGRLRGMRRARGSGKRELLSAPAAGKLFIWFYPCTDADEASERRMAADYPLDDWVVYVWKPDFDRLFSAGAPADHHNDSYPKEPLLPIDRAKAVLRELCPNKAQMPGKLKAATRDVGDECRKRNWKPPSEDTVQRAAAQLGYLPRRKRPPRKRR